MPGDQQLDVEGAIADVMGSLIARFSPSLPASVVEATVRACAACFQDVSVKDFVPLFVERYSVERLWKLTADSTEPGQRGRLASRSTRQIDS